MRLFFYTTTMKRLLTLICALSLCSVVLASDINGTGTLTEHTFRHKGVEYTYYLYLPQSLKADAPLLMVFHGYNSKNIPSIPYGFQPVADREGFAICYPRGPKDHKGKPYWFVGYQFHIENGGVRDDVGFAIRLAKYLQKEYNLSKRNLFATGHSNGGEMCYLLAYLRPELFAAVAPVSGLTMEWMYRELTARKPIPLFEIHGTNDKTSLWEGDPQNIGGWGKYLSVPSAVGYWRAVNRCTHEIREELPVRRNKVIAHKYVGGTEGKEVWLYEIVEGGHSWADKDLDVGEHIWSFFAKYLTTK